MYWYQYHYWISVSDIWTRSGLIRKPKKKTQHTYWAKICPFLKSANFFVHSILFWMIFLCTHPLLMWTGTAVLPLGLSGGRSWDISQAIDWSELIWIDWISVFPARLDQTCRPSTWPRIPPTDLWMRLQRRSSTYFVVPSCDGGLSMTLSVCLQPPLVIPPNLEMEPMANTHVMFTWKWCLRKSIEGVEVPVKADGDELALHSNETLAWPTWELLREPCYRLGLFIKAVPSLSPEATTHWAKTGKAQNQQIISQPW